MAEITEVEMPKAIIHLEALVGSSIFNVNTENCDAAQLLAAGAMLTEYGRLALHEDLKHARTTSNPIEVVRGKIRR